MSNYFYTESFSDDWWRSLSEVYVEEDEIINWFTSYGMDSVMFLYVLIYKSVLIALIACFIFLCYVFIKICLFVLPERKWLETIRDFFSYAMFWNIPFRYFQLIFLDLCISAFMTIRNAAWDDVRSKYYFVSRNVDKVISIILVVFFFITTFVFLVFVARYAFVRWKSIKEVSVRIADLKIGIKEGRKCRTVFYYT